MIIESEASVHSLNHVPLLFINISYVKLSDSHGRRPVDGFSDCSLTSGEGKRRNEFVEWHVAWLAE